MDRFLRYFFSCRRWKPPIQRNTFATLRTLDSKTLGHKNVDSFIELGDDCVKTGKYEQAKSYFTKGLRYLEFSPKQSNIKATTIDQVRQLHANNSNVAKQLFYKRSQVILVFL